MLNFIDRLPYSYVILFGLLLALAPFAPMPHLVEKLMMLKEGTLRRPLDIVDLAYHIAPLIVLGTKIVRDLAR
jgi:hypothetical protein